MQIDIKSLPVHYINMNRHAEKNLDMIQLGRDLKFNNYLRTEGVDMPGHPKAGCATSHYNIFKTMNQPTVILEDDCVILNKKTTIDVPDDADAVYLGLSNWGYLDSSSELGNFSHKRHKDYDNIYKVDGMLATHAILYISQEYIDMSTRVARWHAENDRHIDQGLALIQKYFNVYALGTPMFYQHSNRVATNIRLSGK
jgi:GR25 family glycosyltransferase involved in LPS biosynthesis